MRLRITGELHIYCNKEEERVERGTIMEPLPQIEDPQKSAATTNVVAGDPVVVQMKPWYSSKTLWLNIITFAVMALSMTEFVTTVPDSWGKYIVLAVALLNLALRVFFTDSPISFRAR